MRRSGIPGIGDVPWGAHLCMFYRDPLELLDAVTPFIAAGLEDGEYCMWITAPPVSDEEAVHALKDILPATQDYLEHGQLEIVPYNAWYLRGEEFDHQQVIERWVSRADHAQRMGFAGIRITGNPIWLNSPEQWAQFGQYEQQVHESIKHQQIIALCTYASAQCDTNNMAQVLDTHGYTLHRTLERTWSLTTLTT
jgi:two-component system, LuxR family, sensor kinase FixL